MMLQKNTLRSALKTSQQRILLTPSVRHLSVSRINYATADKKTILKPLGKDSTVENNLLTETNKAERTLSKFWEKVGVNEVSEGFEIQLDGKTMKTPLGNKLVLPKSKRALAHLVANEWKHIPTLSIKSHSLPLTSLASRAIDLEKSRDSKDPEVIAKVGNIDDIKEDMLKYLDTDTLLVFSPKTDCDGTLRPAQEEMYRPIIKSLQNYLKERTGSASFELSYLDCDVGLAGNSQTEEVRSIVKQWMSQLDIWQLVALEKATLTGKSFLCGVALIRMHDHSVKLSDEEVLELEDVARAATLEIIYQTDRWGEVEDTHDVDKVDIRRNLASASLIIYNA